MDAKVLSKLVLAKNFYHRALENAKSQDSLGRMVAIHHLHISIEIVLRSMVKNFDIDGYHANTGFSDLIGIIRKSDYLKSKSLKLPHIEKIRNINQRRNDVQHNFVDPSEDVVAETAIDTQVFLIDSYRTIFDIEFDEVNELSLIHSELLRRLLDLSLRQCKSGCYLESCMSTSVAFDLALNYIHDDKLNRPPFNIRHAKRKVNSDLIGFDRFANEVEKMGSEVYKNTKIIKLILSGIDIKRFAIYSDKKPPVMITMGGSVHFGTMSSTSLVSGKDDAIEASRFVTNTILKVQTLESPSSLDKLSSGIDRYIESDTGKLDSNTCEE